ncbi:hypothetical protein B7463_g9107, partial [Scytalidium lignicola]
MSRRPESSGLLEGMEISPMSELGRTLTIPRKPVAMEPIIEIYPVSSNSDDDSSRQNKPPEYRGAGDFPQSMNGNPWLPGFWRQFPLKGISSLLGCVACIIASVVILVVSDGQPTSSWSLSPTVYLAFLISGTNMLARYTFNEGVKIAWWYRALRGSSVRDLRDHWSHADGFWSALFSGRRFNLVALGSIAVTVMVIDQPLIQRSSSVISIKTTSPTNVTINIAREIPWGFTGVQNGRSDAVQVMTQPMIAAFNDHNSQNAIVQSGTSCSDNCTGYVEAGGLAARCNTTSGPIEYSWLGNQVGAFSYSPFNVNFSVIAAAAPSYPNGTFGTPAQLVMKVGYTNNSVNTNCAGVRTETTCYLASSTIRYPINITGDVIQIGDTVNQGTVQSFQPAPPMANVGTDIENDQAPWTLGGLFIAANNLFASNATYNIGITISDTMDLPDTLSNQFLDFPPLDLSNANSSYMLVSPHACISNWTDPTMYILSQLNEIAFRVSLYASSFPYRDTGAPSDPQVVTMQQVRTINVFRSDYRFLIASTVITMVSVVLITPMFLGWWELGRRVTLNPIEIAKAFDAPSLNGPGSNAPLSQLGKSMGGRGLKYGEVEGFVAGSETKRQLKLTNSVEVSAPRAGEVYI